MDCTALSIAGRISRFCARLNGVRLAAPPSPVPGADAVVMLIRDAHGRTFKVEIARHDH